MLERNIILFITLIVSLYGCVPKTINPQEIMKGAIENVQKEETVSPNIVLISSKSQSNLLQFDELFRQYLSIKSVFLAVVKDDGKTEVPDAIRITISHQTDRTGIRFRVLSPAEMKYELQTDSNIRHAWDGFVEKITSDETLGFAKRDKYLRLIKDKGVKFGGVFSSHMDKLKHHLLCSLFNSGFKEFGFDKALLTPGETFNCSYANKTTKNIGPNPLIYFYVTTLNENEFIISCDICMTGSCCYTIYTEMFEGPFSTVSSFAIMMLYMYLHQV